jgi:hypothetical protein
MGVFDQSGRYASRADPQPVLRRLFRHCTQQPPFREWTDTRILVRPAIGERIADLVAILGTSEHRRLLVTEFQAQQNEDKLDVTLEEVAILRSRARWVAEDVPEVQRRYDVSAALVYLIAVESDNNMTDMRLDSGEGTFHQPLVWHVPREDAREAIEQVARGEESWGLLFWVPLMSGGGEDEVAKRWLEVVESTVQERSRRADLGNVALIFAELAKCRKVWDRTLEGFGMNESAYVNELTKSQVTLAKLEMSRLNLLEFLRGRFSKQTTQEVEKLINQVETLEILNFWIRQAGRVDSFAEFEALVRQ